MQRIAVCIILSLTINVLFAQENITRTARTFGISLGYNMSFVDIGISDVANNSLIQAEGKAKPGFELGINFTKYLTDKIGARIQSIISFQESQVEFEFDGTSARKFQRTREMVSVLVPLNFVYENLNKKFGPSFTLGGSASFLLNDPTVQNPALPLLKKEVGLSLDVGAGVHFTFKKFMFKPELIYSKGLHTQASYDGVLNSSLSKNRLDQVLLRFSFYGV